MNQIFKITLLMVVIISIACTTKVSEWFLLNAESDKYLLVYYHNRPMTTAESTKVSEIEKQSSAANVIVKTIENENIEKPYYALYYKNKLFQKFEDNSELSGILTSPLREDIAEELLSGQLCTMLFLNSGDKEKDETGLKVLQESVAASPVGDIVSIKVLDRGSVDEKQFVMMLLNIEDDLKDIEEPMLFGIFGRFRTLEPLLAKGISKENINLLLDFLTADCSCLIKDNLPGINILCTHNWLNPQPALVNNILSE